MTQRPIIGIFLTGAVPTEEEQKIIDLFFKERTVIVNARNLEPNENLHIDCAVGAIPERYADLPTPETLLEQYADDMKNIGAKVGGLPPTPPKDDEKQKGETKPNTGNGFGTPPTPPKDK